MAVLSTGQQDFSPTSLQGARVLYVIVIMQIP